MKFPFLNQSFKTRSKTLLNILIVLALMLSIAFFANTNIVLSNAKPKTNGDNNEFKTVKALDETYWYCDMPLAGVFKQNTGTITQSPNKQMNNLKDLKELPGSKTNGVIIQLTKDSMLEFKKQLESKLASKQIDKAMFNKLLAKHEQEITQQQEQVITIIENEFNKKLDKKQIKTYKQGLNAVFFKHLTMQECELLKKQHSSLVKKCFPNRDVKAMLSESVPLIRAPEVWQLHDASGNNVTGLGVVIAIIDTGVDYQHPDLGGCFGANCKVIGGYDFVNDDPDPMDDNGHGTHVASIAAGTGAASNGLLKGVAPDAKILAYKVLDSNGVGWESDVIAGMEAAYSQGADVLSISIGAWVFHTCSDYAMSVEAETLASYGIPVVVAAGNEGPNIITITAPGCAPSVITVGASTKQDTVAVFSSSGPINYVAKPDVVAPGVNICAAKASNTWNANYCYGTSYVLASGTSMATPHVSGVIALLKQLHQNWNSNVLKQALKDTAISLNENLSRQGFGRIDAFLAATEETPSIAVLNPLNPVFNDNVLRITGTAAGINFEKYKVFIGEGLHPSSYQLLYESSTPIIQGILYEAPSNELPRGNYQIKLEVQDHDDKGEARIHKSYAYLINRYNERIKQGWPQRVEKVLFLYSNVLLSSITPVVSPDNDFIALSTTMLPSTSKVYAFTSDGGLLQNWPVQTQGMTATTPNFFVTIDDVDNDGEQDIILVTLSLTYTSGSTNIYVFNRDGTIKQGWPRVIDEVPFTAAVTKDIDNDGLKEIILALTTFETNDDVLRSKIYAFKPDGVVMNGYPLTYPALYGYTRSMPAVGDYDNDGEDEFIIFTVKGHLLALSKTGAIEQSRRLYGDEFEDNQATTFPEIVDIDNDNVQDIVLLVDKVYRVEPPNIYYADDVLYVLNHDFSDKPGWPKQLDTVTDIQFLAPPAIADVDNDGFLEIGVKTVHYTYLLNHKGQVLSGWPKTNNHHSHSIGLRDGVTIANIDEDPDLELLTYDFPDFKVVKKDGTLMEEYSLRDWCFIDGYITVKDIDSDGLQEIIAASGDGYVYVFDTEGQASTTNDWEMFRQSPNYQGFYEFRECPEFAGQCDSWLGDVDFNNLLTSFDLELLKQMIPNPNSNSQQTPPNPCADIVRDCNINIKDYTALQDRINNCEPGLYYCVGKPGFCSNGELVSNCRVCGCPLGNICQEDGTCKPVMVSPFTKISNKDNN